jgi:hypothetical protein
MTPQVHMPRLLAGVVVLVMTLAALFAAVMPAINHHLSAHFPKNPHTTLIFANVERAP